ncbi:MAG TPA: hypothetical protein VGB30_02885 [bacterium]|jgi:hypothetical protein
MPDILIPIIGFSLGLLPVVVTGIFFGFTLSGKRTPSPGCILTGIATVFAIYSFCVTLLGLSGLLRFLTPITFAFPVIFFAITLISRARSGRDRLFPKVSFSLWIPRDKYSIVLIWLMLIFQAAMLIGALAPYYNPDCEMQHYLFLKNYLVAGKIFILPQNGYSYYPQSVEMLVMSAFDHAGKSGPEAGNFSFWFIQLIFILIMVDFCARRGKPLSGWILAALVCGLYQWYQLAYSGYIDGIVAFFVVTGIFYYFDWLDGKDETGYGLIIAGLLLGIGAASKYSALPLVFLATTHLVWLSLVSRDRSITSRSILCILVLFLAASPWYLRNLTAAGNMFFPFLRDYFGGSDVLIADDFNTWKNLGIPVTFLNFILYPFKLAFLNHVDSLSFLVTPARFETWLLPVAPIAGLFLLKKRTSRLAYFWLALFFIPAFFIMNAKVRYFIHFTILAMWLIADFLGNPPDRDSDFPPRINRFLRSGIASWVIVLLVSLPLFLQFALMKSELLKARPFLTGKMSRDEYDNAIARDSEIFSTANELGQEGNGICTFILRVYRLEVPFVYPPDKILAIDTSPAQAVEILRESNVRYILISRPRKMSCIYINWGLSREVDDDGKSVLLQDAMSELAEKYGGTLDAFIGLIRSMGARPVELDGKPAWVVDLQPYRVDSLNAMIRFLSSIPDFENKGILGIIDSGEYLEIYEISEN